MSYPRKAIVPFLALILCLSSQLLLAQSSSPSRDLQEGIDFFRDGQYARAIPLFQNLLAASSADAQKPVAYLLLAKSYMATGKLDDAERNLEYYLANYPGSTDYAEALYQKGRLLFMQEDYESALQVFQGFLSNYPSSTFASSGWFWVGESLYSLGKLDDALTVYQKIIRDYPSSVKVEAAQYKVSLIQLRKKEIELSRLLKWSHEDFLKSTEGFQNREKSYEQAIAAYQKRLAAGSADDQKTIADLRQQLADKTAEANQLSAQVARLGNTPPTASSAETAQEEERLANLQRLLAAKQKALALKELYLTWMLSHGQPGTGAGAPPGAAGGTPPGAAGPGAPK
jgi:TolA-binding protein